jgi:hypothetical protein
MTPPRNPNTPDPDRLISAFLSEGQTDLPDQVYDEVRAEIDHTDQRTFIGPWRTSFVNRFATVAAIAVVMVVAVLVGLQLTQGGLLVGGNLSPSPSATAEPSTSGTPTSKPTPTEPAAETPGETSGPEPDFVCGQPIHLDAVGSDFHPLVVADIRLGTHDGYDRIVFEYVDAGTPDFDVGEAQPPFAHDPSGLPLDVAGDPVFELRFTGATKFDTESGDQPYTGSTDFEPGYPQIVQFVESSDFEGTHKWYLGVNGGDCLRAFYLTDPSRIVIDVQH